MRTTRRILSVFACAPLIFGGCILNGCSDAEPQSEEQTELSPEEQAELDAEVRALGRRLARLETTEQSETESTGDALCDMINRKRAEYGSGALTINNTLMQAAAVRVAELQADRTNPLHSRQNGTEWSTILTEYGIHAVVCGETVLTGGADENTVFHAMLLNLSQTSYLTYEGYTQFGYAHNDISDIWVLLLTE